MASVDIPRVKSTLPKGFCQWPITALIGSSWLIKGKRHCVSATLLKLVRPAAAKTLLIPIKAAFGRMFFDIPLGLVHRQMFGQLFITLTNVVSTRADLIGAFDRLFPIRTGNQVGPVSDILAPAGVAMLID